MVIWGGVQRPLFVMVNRLTPIKQVLRILQCVKELNSQFNFTLWIIGDGEQREELEEFSLKNNLNNVVFLGRQENPYPFIAKADWFISASEYETFGLTVHEATVLNVPSLVATLPVFEECVSKDKVILVENSYQGLLAGMQYILEHPNLRKEMSSKPLIGYTQEELYLNRLRDIEDLFREDDQ